MFSALEWIEGFPDGDPAENLATDEALFLRMGERPLFRVYRWDRPAFSIGYFMRYREVSARVRAEGLPCVRRITGGGMVKHGEDLTVMLAVPSTDPFCRLRAAVSYRMIHARIADALRSIGRSTTVAGEPAERARQIGGDCFSNPVAADLLGDGDGKKIVGGAQRRTRGGLLYQGTLQIPGLRETPRGFSEALARGFSRRIDLRPIAPGTVAEARRLMESRYGRSEWSRRR